LQHGFTNLDDVIADELWQLSAAKPSFLQAYQHWSADKVVEQMLANRDRVKQFACMTLNEVLSVKCFGQGLKQKLHAIAVN
jgi:hypothetical protein